MRTASSNPTRPVSTLEHRLERDRLEQRAVRVRQVIHALRERAAVRDGGRAPRPLTAAIEDFGRELAELELRLREPGREPLARAGGEHRAAQAGCASPATAARRASLGS